MPDVTIQPLKISKLDPSEVGEGVHEADLKGRLDNPNAKPEDAKAKDGKPAEDAKKDDKKDGKPEPINIADLAVNDYELYEALNLLKGMSIAQSR